MITLHRIGHEEPVMVNADLLVTAEANPDTVVLLATGARMVVNETPEQVSDAVRHWRAQVLAAGLSLHPLTLGHG